MHGVVQRPLQKGRVRTQLRRRLRVLAQQQVLLPERARLLQSQLFRLPRGRRRLRGLRFLLVQLTQQVEQLVLSLSCWWCRNVIVKEYSLVVVFWC